MLIAASVAFGLYLDAAFDLPGQLAASVLAWAVFLWLAARRAGDERRMLFLCLLIATAGELFLSLVWGLYRYRLDNIPMFVPPDHALLLILGIALARRMPDAIAHAVFALAGLYTLGAAWYGLDVFGLSLYALLAVCVLCAPDRRRLFASTFLLTLALELYGTWLGNWTWAHEVPWLGIATTNPPLVAGAFYCALDLLVVAALGQFRVPAGETGKAARAAPG